MIARLDFRSAILDFVINESLNLVIETLDQLSHVLKCLEAVPVTDAFHDLYFLFACTDFLEHPLATLERCALVLLASEDQYGDVDLAVVRRFGIDDHSAVRAVAGGVLTKEELSNKSRSQRGSF